MFTRASSLRRLLLGAALIAGVSAAPAVAAGPTALTPLTASMLATPEAVTGSDGRQHVVYEILLGNPERVRLEVQSLAVRTSGGRTVAKYDTAQMAELMSTVSGPTNSLAPGEGGTAWVDLTFGRDQRVPRALVHRFTVLQTAPNGETRTTTFTAVPTNVSRRRALSLAAPLHGGPYLNFNGCCGMSPHRTAIAPVDAVPYLSERFASDFIKIDAAGRGGAGDLTKNESFFTFGEPVFAVADAVVVSTLNTVPENTPLNEPPGSAFTLQTILGNNVVLKLPDGRYAAYGHLQTGSVRVHRGQRVRKGQVLARVGNTGQSGGAHLHFQLSDGPDPVASDGVPFVFGRFTLTGNVTNIDEFLTGAANADVRPLSPASRRSGELPLHATVVRF